MYKTRETHMEIAIWCMRTLRDRQMYQGSLCQPIDAVNTSMLILGWCKVKLELLYRVRENEFT